MRKIYVGFDSGMCGTRRLLKSWEQILTSTARSRFLRWEFGEWFLRNVIAVCRSVGDAWRLSSTAKFPL